MNIEQAILESLQKLPLDKQQEVLDFTEFLQQKKQAILRISISSTTS
jgi:hypothetical protein